MQPHRPHQVGQDEDFGIKPDKAAEYAKQRGDDHLGRPAGDKMVGSGQSVREHGVGATSGGGAGKGSGGDIDPELLGLESQYAPVPGVERPAAPADAARNPDGTPNIGGDKEIHGGHVQASGPDAAAAQSQNDKQSGGGIASNRGSTEDDAFVSEVTLDEADGRDQSQGG